MDTDDERLTGSALARGIGVLRCFSSRSQRLTRKELVARTGLPKATVSRLAQTLCDLNLLRADAERGSFVLGPELLTFVPAVLGQVTLRQVARPGMQELADHARAQVTIAVGTGDSLIFAEICQGQGSDVFRPDIGTRLSLTRTASGRAYLVTERPELRDQVLEHAAERAEWLGARLAETRQDLAKRGFALNIGDMHPDVMGAAVPVRMADGQILVFTATVTAFQTSRQQLQSDVGPRLYALVQRVVAAVPEQANLTRQSGRTASSSRKPPRDVKSVRV